MQTGRPKSITSSPKSIPSSDNGINWITGLQHLLRSRRVRPYWSSRGTIKRGSVCCTSFPKTSYPAHQLLNAYCTNRSTTLGKSHQIQVLKQPEKSMLLEDSVEDFSFYFFSFLSFFFSFLVWGEEGDEERSLTAAVLFPFIGRLHICVGGKCPD